MPSSIGMPSPARACRSEYPYWAVRNCESTVSTRTPRRSSRSSFPFDASRDSPSAIT